MKCDTINNSISAIVLQIVTAIAGIILPKLLISTYGSDINGMVSSITQFIGYLALVEAGIGNASIVQLYKPLAENSIGEVNGILSATNKFYKKSGSLFIFLVIILLIIYPLFVSGQVDYYTVIWMICILSLSSIFDYFFLGKYRVLLTADQKLYVINYVQCIGTLLNIVVTITLIRMNFTILTVKFFATLIYIFRMFLIYIYVKNHYGYLNFDVTPLTEKLSDRWSVLSHQIAGMVVLNTDIVVLTIFKIPLSEISVYTVYNLVLNVIIGLLNSLLNAVTPLFGRILVTDKSSMTREYYSIYEFLYFILTFALFTSLVILFIPFLNIYTQGITDANYIRLNLALTFCLMGLIYMIRTPALTLINASGHYKQTQKGAFIEAGINIIVSLILVSKFGIEGVLLGTICSHCFRSIELMKYNNDYIIKNSIRTTLIRIIRNIILMLIIILSYRYIFIINVNDFITWCIFATLITISSFLFILIFNILCEKEYYYLLKEKLLRGGRK